jgi:hypothetical protein
MPFAPDPISISKIKKLIEHFPIGERIDYYPEYQENLLLPSIILGYEINGHPIYSKNQIRFGSTKSGTEQLTLVFSDSQHDCLKINTFCIILPGNAGEENKLDYPRKASLGKLGQFRNGNSITLVARGEDHGVVSLDSQVRESVQPKEGFYRGHLLTLLQVFSPQLSFRDQRTHHRIKTRLPLKLQLSIEEPFHTCLLMDYSELHAQVEIGNNPQLLDQLKPQRRIIISMKLEHSRRTFVISAEVVRKQNSTIIIVMQQILNNGHFEPFELMDALDVKASLLQHPDTEAT